MELVEVLREPLSAGNAAEADGRAGGWSVRMVPADLPVLKRREFLCAAVAAFILGLALLYPWFSRTPAGGIQLCWFHRITGLPCLLCGMTRSLAAAVRFDIGGSFYYHLLGPFLFLFLILLPASLALLVSGRRLELKMPDGTRRLVTWFLFAAFVAALVLKLAAFGVNV